MKTKIPSWPQERTLSRYAEFTAIDFNNDLSHGEIWIDIGCRTGKALSETHKFYKAKLIGVNAHKIRVRSGIKAIFASIPDDIIVYKQYRKKANIVTDVHGAVSYCENPLEALIYEACLLKPDAKAVIVTLEGRMGNPATWKRIERFFKLIMQQKIEFKRFRSYTNHTKSPIRTLRITITGHCRARWGLKNLFMQARQYVGEMRKKKIIAQPLDKTFQIWQAVYTART